MIRPSIFATTLALLFVCASQPARAQTPDWREYPEIDISVSGVTLGMPYAEVLKRLGEPVAYQEPVSTPPPPAECLPKSAVLVYPGLTVKLGGTELNDLHVWSIHVMTNDWAVAPGIRVGESMEDVRRLLGEPGREVVFHGGKRRIIAYATAGKTGTANLIFRGKEALNMIILTEACRRRTAEGARLTGE